MIVNMNHLRSFYTAAKLNSGKGSPGGHGDSPGDHSAHQTF